MKHKKVKIQAGALNYILNAVWHGASIFAACRIAGVKSRELRRYRKIYKSYDAKLKKFREPYAFKHKLFKEYK